MILSDNSPILSARWLMTCQHFKTATNNVCLELAMIVWQFKNVKLWQIDMLVLLKTNSKTSKTNLLTLDFTPTKVLILQNMMTILPYLINLHNHWFLLPSTVLNKNRLSVKQLSTSLPACSRRQQKPKKTNAKLTIKRLLLRLVFQFLYLNLGSKINSSKIYQPLLNVKETQKLLKNLYNVITMKLILKLIKLCQFSVYTQQPMKNKNILNATIKVNHLMIY